MQLCSQPSVVHVVSAVFPKASLEAQGTVCVSAARIQACHHPWAHVCTVLAAGCVSVGAKIDLGEWGGGQRGRRPSEGDFKMGMCV